MRRRFTGSALTGAATLAVLTGALAVGQLPARAAAADGVYPSWDSSGASGAWTGHGDLDAAGFPVAGLSSNATSVSVSAGGSAFLGTSTPFGQAFGSSQGKPYVNIATAAAFAPSTTTLTFASPTPGAGWGFALGDVDADAVTVSATNAQGNAVSAAQLGWQSSFNYCTNSPKPSSCTGPGPFDDVPTWDPGTATLTGGGSNTFGASGWFEPTVALSSLTLTFTRQVGSPTYQLWLAALAVPITGTVDGVKPSDPPPSPGVVIDLQQPDGTAVTDSGGDPVTARVDDHGRFEFPAVVDGDYRLAIDPPARTSITGDHHADVTVDVTAGSTTVPAGTFAVHVTPRATPPPSHTAPAGSGSVAGVSATAPSLAATGTDAGWLAGLALALLLGGGAMLAMGRRGRRS